MKTCFKCKEEKPKSSYYKHKQMGDGLLGKCKECSKKDVVSNRIKRKAYYDKFDKDRYRKSIKRMLSSKYSCMYRRVNGKTNHSKLTGFEILPKDDFMRWAYETIDDFMKHYNKWEESGYQRKLAPSIDRIDNKRGYVVGNMQWLSQKQNSEKYNK